MHGLYLERFALEPEGLDRLLFAQQRQRFEWLCEP